MGGGGGGGFPLNIFLGVEIFLSGVDKFSGGGGGGLINFRGRLRIFSRC